MEDIVKEAMDRMAMMLQRTMARKDYLDLTIGRLDEYPESEADPDWSPSMYTPSWRACREETAQIHEWLKGFCAAMDLMHGVSLGTCSDAVYAMFGQKDKPYLLREEECCTIDHDAPISSLDDPRKAVSRVAEHLMTAIGIAKAAQRR